MSVGCQLPVVSSRYVHAYRGLPDVLTTPKSRLKAGLQPVGVPASAGRTHESESQHAGAGRNTIVPVPKFILFWPVCLTSMTLPSNWSSGTDEINLANL